MSHVQKKPGFMSQLIPFMVIFLALQLFFMSRNQPPDPRTSDQILAQMRDECRKKLDVTIASTNSALDSKLHQELEARTVSPDEATRKKLEGDVLVTTAKLTAGIELNDLSRTELAFQSMQPEWKVLKDSPFWYQTSFETPYGPTTASDLYERARNALNDSNKKDVLYGFIPAYQTIDFLVRLTGSNPAFSYWAAALMLAIFVRALIFPLSQRQLMWGRQMSQLQPLAKEIRAKYKDPQEQGLKTMELYKEYGINPYAGCLPALIQLPLFLTVYRCMLHYRFQFVAGTFLWINPSTAAAYKYLGFFAPAANLGLEDRSLIIIYGITMVISTLLTPVSDPNNMKQQRLMGVGIAVLFAGMMLFGAFPVPSAFVLYWTFTNILATAQSLRAYRMPMPPLVKVNATTGGVYPVKPKKAGWADKLRESFENAQRAALEQSKVDPPKEDDIQPYKPENKMPKNGALNGQTKKAAHKPKKRK